MGTECSTFTLSTRNCTAGKGRTGWNTGTLNDAEGALEVEDVKDSITWDNMNREKCFHLRLQQYLAPHDDR